MAIAPEIGAAAVLFLWLFLFRFFFVLLQLVSVVYGQHFFFVLIFVGNHVHVDGMDLQHLEFHIALRAGEDFSFFYFVFVHVNFGVAFRASHHGTFSFPV
jgi:hypothetical protein